MKKIFQNNTIYFSCNKVTLYVNVYIISYLTLISQKQDILSSLVRKDINLAQSVGYIRFIFSLVNSLKILYSKPFQKRCMVEFYLISNPIFIKWWYIDIKNSSQIHLKFLLEFVNIQITDLISLWLYFSWNKFVNSM